MIEKFKEVKKIVNEFDEKNINEKKESLFQVTDVARSIKNLGGKIGMDSIIKFVEVLAGELAKKLVT